MSSELIMCGGGVHIISLLLLVARCIETINVYIYGALLFYVCCMWGSVGMFVVLVAIVEDSSFKPWSVESRCMFV